MFCQKCGKEIFDEAIVCPFCGCQTGNISPIQNKEPAKPSVETDAIAKAAFICAFLVHIVGLILGIIGCATYKNTEYKQKCITAIIVSVVMCIIGMIFYSVLIGVLSALEYLY